MRWSRPLAITVVASLFSLGGMVDASAADKLAPFSSAPAGRGVPGAYIVTVRSDGDSVARRHEVHPKAVYSASVRGFAARMSDRQLDAVRRDKDVVAVEADQIYRTASSQTVSTGGWGLDRIDQRGLPLNSTYTYNTTASNVTAYIIDTGIQLSQPQFGGRALKSYDVFGGTGNDCNGHGTHVAGLVGANTYGVAKRVKLRAVRVLDCQGSGDTSGVIAGIDWVRRNAAKPAVANLSLTGPKSAALNSAVTSLADSGVAVAVAAGNDSINACNASPAGAGRVVTVAAMDKTDHHASFSNYGSCVELYAPGVTIRSSWLDGTSTALSGTSMSSPLVAGTMALRLAKPGVTAAAAQSWVVTSATTGVIIGEPTGTPDRLLFKSTL